MVRINSPPSSVFSGSINQFETRTTDFPEKADSPPPLIGFKLPSLTARQVEVILERNGFKVVPKAGCDRKWRNVQTQRQVMVHSHGNKTLPKGTLRSIVKGSGIPGSEWLS